MNNTKKYPKNPSPEASANIFSTLFYCWTLPFFKHGYLHSIKLKDIYNTIKPDSSSHLGDKLERKWFDEVENATKTGRKPNLQKTIFKTFYKTYLILGILLLFHSTVIRLLQPVLLAKYIHFTQSRATEDSRNGWWIGSAVVFVAVLNIIISHYNSLNCQRIGMRIRIACCSLIYRKLLRLSQQSLEQTTLGHLINLLSNDVQRFDNVAVYIHFLWIMPLHFALSFYIMYQSVGVAAGAGMFTVAIQVLLIQGYLSRLQGKLRYKIACRTDHRIKLLSEIIFGIQVVKLYAWEKPFKHVVDLARKLEIDVITKTGYIKGMSTGMMVFTERFILYLTLLTYVLLGNTLTGDVVFSLAQLFNIVQHYVAFMFPNALATYSEARVSIRRIEQILLLEEKRNAQTHLENGGCVQLTQVEASWNISRPTLSNLNLSIEPGSLCCVIGNIGSGKSSLLNLLIGELSAKEGVVNVSTSISYCSQEPWLFISTVRNNILFGKKFLRERYKEVLRVCCLETDLDQFIDGDKTIVGERGAVLSGGQKARINLARAVYSDTALYLLDDPLSAVDTHVANQLFEECIMKYLSGKTRILVTHQLQYLKQSDMVVVMSNGTIEYAGKFEQLSVDQIRDLCKEVPAIEHKEVQIKKINPELPKRSRLSSVYDDDAKEDDELIEKGSIARSTYTEYCRAGNNVWVLALLIVLLIVAQVASNSCDFLLQYWSNIGETGDLDENLPQDVGFSHHRQDRLLIVIYSIFITTSIIFTSARSILFYKICMNISRTLHRKTFSCILNAPMRFFNTNPSGRIINRFSKDMGIIDEFLPPTALDAIQIFLVLCGIFTMVFIVTPIAMVPALFLMVLFYFIRSVYLSVAQDLKRFEGLTKAPVFSHTSASIQGLSTIRASNTQAVLIEDFDSLQDQHTSTWVLFLATSEAFGFYLDVISTIFLALVTFQFLIFDVDTLSGDVGLVISQTLVLSGMLQFGVRQTAEIASNMISVERVLQYTKLDDENAGTVETHETVSKESWPDYGRIVFKNVYLEYTPNQESILKNINLDIKEKEKIGIVGRTGAGKSSIIATLFRLVSFEGIIFIDNVDISTLKLEKLRSKISIIPQDPVLFSGTIRYNLDPFGNQKDDTLWEVLETVRLKGAINSLDQEVSEGGSNFSIGQKQLICLARAIIRNNKILVMDEATAHVDVATDNFIHETVRAKFKDCTVLTIAHRLGSIIDSDRILVMDSGRVVEFDKPDILLQIPDGQFANMVQETGIHMEQKLRRVAKEHNTDHSPT